MYRTFLASLALSCAMTLTVRGADYGNLTGQILFDGDAPAPAALTITKDAEVCGQHMLVNEELLVDPATKGIANVVVFIRSKVDEKAVHPDVLKNLPAQITVDNKNCRFEPHVSVIWFSKQEALLKNSDSVGHNTNLAPIGDSQVNPLLSANAEQIHKFKKKQNLPVPVSCNIHPWMKGYVVVRDNPYTAVTSVDGKFNLENIPVGKHEIAVWHEKSGWVDTKDWPKGKFEFQIKAGENDLGEVRLPVKLFSK